MRRGLNVKRLLSIALVLASGLAAQAAPLSVTDAWFRALPGTLPAGGYFTAHNATDHQIAITGARSGACGMLMLHQSKATGGMSSMDMVDKVAVPPGGEVRFAPGGYHLMCENPRMKIGGKAPVQLTLSDGTAVTVAFAVRGATGK
jgi:copper(I)-binding protein